MAVRIYQVCAVENITDMDIAD